MILYHGSKKAIERPDLSFSRLRTDFGKGFYLTPLKTQAESWAQRFIRGHGAAMISSYDFLPGLDEKPPAETRILEFGEYSLDWLNFIASCRLGLPVDTVWDLVIGGVANDKVFDTLQLYFDRLITADDAIGRLRYSQPNLQYCFKDQYFIDGFLRYKGSEVLI
jgi:hypothetical protein